MTENPGTQDTLRPADIGAIILLGVALGVLFNALQLADNPARALAWVKQERAVVALEPEPAAATATPSPAATTAAPGAAATPAPGAAAAPAKGAAPSAARAVGLVSSAKAGVAPAGPAAATPARLARAVPVTPTGNRATSPVPAGRPAGGTSSAPAQLPGTPIAPETGSPAPAGAPAAPAIPDAREPREATLPTVRALYDAGTAVVLDARSREEYVAGHIAGAVNLPFDDVFKDPSLAKPYASGGRVLVTYCDGGDCDLSRSLAFSLIDAGARKVLVFKDGYPAWKDAGSPVRTGSQP